MSENTDALKKAYDAFNEGDLDGASEIWADDIKWESTVDERVPGGGMHEGKDDAKEALASISESFESFSASPDEIIEAESTVIVLGHSEGKTKSGNDVKVPFVHVWRFEDDKIQRGQLLTDTSVVVDALGDSDGDSDDDSDDGKDEDNDEGSGNGSEKDSDDDKDGDSDDD